MQKRQLIISGLGIVILLSGFGGFKFLKSLKTPPPRKTTELLGKKVPVMPAAPQDLPVMIEITGKLTAADKTQIYAEVSGIMSVPQKPFKEGIAYKKGEVMLDFEDREVKQTLLSHKSDFLSLLTQAIPDMKFDFPERAEKWSNYLQNYHIEKRIPALPAAEDEKEKYFLAARNIYNKYYTIKSMEAKVDKFSIRAPFDGVLSSALINPGTLVRSGQLLGEYIGRKNYELEAAVSLSDLRFVYINAQAKLYDETTGISCTGKVARISNKIDENTQTARIILSVSADGLRDGMFLSGEITGKANPNSLYLSRKLITGDGKIYIVKNDSLQLLPIDAVRYGKSKALLQNIAPGTLIATEMVPGAYDGLPVTGIPAEQ